MAFNDPRVSLTPLVWCALAVAFGSATQDIALDAYRIESADTDRQAALAATYQTGYRLAMIWAGAGVLWLAARAEVAGHGGLPERRLAGGYLAMAASMAVGHADRAALAGTGATPAGACPQRGRVAAWRAGRALRRLPGPLPLAGGCWCWA